MQYPFNTREHYLDAKQKKIVDDFIESGLWCGEVCTNSAGEKREIEDVQLPQGTIVDAAGLPEYRRTQFIPGRMGERHYHTPYATHTGPEPLIVFKDSEGVMQQEHWTDFRKWIGDSYTVSPKPPDPPDVKGEGYRKMILKQMLEKHKVDEAEKMVAEKRKPIEVEETNAPEKKEKKGK